MYWINCINSRTLGNHTINFAWLGHLIWPKWIKMYRTDHHVIPETIIHQAFILDGLMVSGLIEIGIHEGQHYYAFVFRCWIRDLVEEGVGSSPFARNGPIIVWSTSHPYPQPIGENHNYHGDVNCSIIKFVTEYIILWMGYFQVGCLLSPINMNNRWTFVPPPDPRAGGTLFFVFL